MGGHAVVEERETREKGRKETAQNYRRELSKAIKKQKIVMETVLEGPGQVTNDTIESGSGRKQKEGHQLLTFQGPSRIAPYRRALKRMGSVVREDERS